MSHINRRAGLAAAKTAALLLCAASAAGRAAAGAGAAEAAAILAPAARPAVSKTLDLAHGIADVPREAVQILCLPWGVVECVFSPLPEVSFMSGLRHMGRGLLAPFRFAEAVVMVPVKAIAAVDAISGVALQPAAGIVPQ